MKRVLLGPFRGVPLAGLRDVLDDAAIQLLEMRTEDIVDEVVDLLPDVVILDRDAGVHHDLVRSVQARFPAVKILDCSTENNSIRIYPPFHDSEYYDSCLDAELLRRAVMS